MKLLDKHAFFEKNSIFLLIGILIVISIGGLVEIVPLFYLENTIEKVEGMRPYTPLELAGRNIYVREGCYNCHSQMIRATRDEVERYGHYSLAAESMYDHPFQWGSKRNGPDLARVGNKYSDEWHREHMIKPSSVVPETIMPGYPFLAKANLKYSQIDMDLKVNQMIGVPYSDEQVENAIADLKAQLDEDSDDYDAFIERYPTAQVRDFDGNPAKISELDALIAYLQMLGTLVDFSLYNESENNR
ncbi:MAG: cytochrome-c oxidase, cbb3-type subunit II [Emcibacteraceae bacterium]|nr:cytochrome-c oxidase, cbb3-type subunit II [Emcibacteraceae bacterium]